MGHYASEMDAPNFGRDQIRARAAAERAVVEAAKAYRAAYKAWALLDDDATDLEAATTKLGSRERSFHDAVDALLALDGAAEGAGDAG